MPLKLMGCTVHPNVNNGEPVPLYEETRECLSTLEGWNAYVLKTSIEEFSRAHGRHPTCDHEALEYNRARCEMAIKECAI